MTLTFEQFKELRQKGLSDDQIRNFESGNKPQQTQTQPQEPVLLDKLKERGKNIIEPLIKPGEATTGILGKVMPQMNVAGQVAGVVGDVIGAGVESAYKNIVPEKTQETIKQHALDILKTPVGIAGIEAIKAGSDVYKKFSEANPNVARDLENVVNIGSLIPIGKGASVAGKEGLDITEDVAKLGGKLIEGDVAKKASTDTFKALKPRLTINRDLKTIREKLNVANDAIVSQGIKPNNFKEYVDALNTSKKNIWSQIQSKLDASKSSIDLGNISDELRKIASDKNLLRVDKSASKKITSMADNLVANGRNISVLDAEQIKQYLNSELQGAFGKFNLSKAEQNAKKLITSKIGSQLDNVLSSIPNEFSNLKKTYGAIREMEEDALKRLVVFERQNPESLVDSFSKISGVGNILKGFIPGGGGVSQIAKGVGELALGQIQKRANDADVLIKKAFDRLYKSKKQFEPKSKTLKMLNMRK